MRILAAIFLIILILKPCVVYSQNKLWSLDECIRYAIEYNIDIKKQKLVSETSNINLSESKWSYVPTIALSNSYNISQGRVLDPTTYEFIEDEMVQGNSTSVSASMVLFDGMRKMHNLKKNVLNLQSSLLKIEKAKNDLTLNITVHYLEILLAKENIRNTEQIVTTLKIQENNTKKKVDARKVIAADLLQIQSNLADAEIIVLTAKNQLYTAKSNICQLLEINDYMSFETVAPDDALIDISKLPQTIHPILNNALSLPEVNIAKLDIDIAKKDLSIALANYCPTVSLSATYGSSHSNARQKTFQNPNGTYQHAAYPFVEQYRDNFNSDISIGVNIPIFNGFASRKNVQRQLIAIEHTKYSLKIMEKQVVKEINQAYIDMLIAWDKYHLSQKYVKSATEVVKQIERKYNLGAAIVFDYNTSLNNLVEANAKFLQAKYEYIFKTRIIKFYMGS